MPMRFSRPIPTQPVRHHGLRRCARGAAGVALAALILTGCSTPQATISGRATPAAEARTALAADSSTGAVGTPQPSSTPRPDTTATAAAVTAQAQAARATADTLATIIALREAAQQATAQVQAVYDSGQQIFRDEFVDNRNNWFTGRFNEKETDAVEDDVFKVKWDADGTSYELYDGKELSNFIAQVDCVVIKGEKNGSCGLVFAHKTDVGFYKFEVFNDYYRLFIVAKDAEPRLLAEGDPEGIVNPNNTNYLRVIRINNEIRIYLNNQLLNIATDETFTVGKLGVSTSSYRPEGEVEVWFDNFTIWELPSS